MTRTVADAAAAPTGAEREQGLRIAIGADEVTPLARAMVAALRELGHEPEVVGPLIGGHQEWAGVSAEVARRVADGSSERGVVLCWSGTGASIAANKVPGARAALCADAETARMARRYNHANVLALSMRLTSEPLGREILEAFLTSPEGDEPFDLRNVAALDAVGRRPDRSAPVPVVLVHGLIGDLDLPEVRAGLAPRPVFTPALLGYGGPARRGFRPDLEAQAEHLAGIVEAIDAPRVHLVGHSVGAVVAILCADRCPERVASLVSIEGNFTLADAFWSATFAEMTGVEVEATLAGYRADPAGWLRTTGIDPDDRMVRVAERWLAHQPAGTLHAQATSVVKLTGLPEYARLVRRVVERTPTYLLAGERSRDGWDVPEWAVRHARDAVFMPGVGHLMMLEQPEHFAETLAGLLRRAELGPDSASQ